MRTIGSINRIGKRDVYKRQEYTIDLSKLEPTVAFPHLPENTKTMNEISQ